MEPTKSLILIFSAALLLILLGCTRPDFRVDIQNALKSTEELRAELERLQQVNVTVGSEEFDVSDYPAFVGVDVRNGKILIEKFICWDGCPELGKVYLVYQAVATEEACLKAAGSPLISPVPIPGAYWGCEPIISLPKVPARPSG